MPVVLPLVIVSGVVKSINVHALHVLFSIIHAAEDIGRPVWCHGSRPITCGLVYEASQQQHVYMYYHAVKLHGRKLWHRAESVHSCVKLANFNMNACDARKSKCSRPATGGT